MATPVELILICLVAVALLALVARKIGVPYPILLTIAGGLLAFVPGLPTIRLDPKRSLDGEDLSKDRSKALHEVESGRGK